VNFFADDLDAARRWYTEVLGVEPYFAEGVEGQTAYLDVPHRRLQARAQADRSYSAMNIEGQQAALRGGVAGQNALLP
jgi:catechol 2,3-dioxygenase-like lactoylglutathione lyase family enzyme